MVAHMQIKYKYGNFFSRWLITSEYITVQMFQRLSENFLSLLQSVKVYSDESYQESLDFEFYKTSPSLKLLHME